MDVMDLLDELVEQNGDASNDGIISLNLEIIVWVISFLKGIPLCHNP
jgi:hypothetical protein